MQWNFEKFLLAPGGEVVNRFRPRTVPDAPEVISAIEAVPARACRTEWSTAARVSDTVATPALPHCRRGWTTDRLDVRDQGPHAGRHRRVLRGPRCPLRAGLPVGPAPEGRLPAGAGRSHGGMVAAPAHGGDAIVLHGYDEAATKKRRGEFATSARPRGQSAADGRRPSPRSPRVAHQAVRRAGLDGVAGHRYALPRNGFRLLAGLTGITDLVRGRRCGPGCSASARAS